MFDFKMKFPSVIHPDKQGRAIVLQPKGFWTKDRRKIKGSDFEGPEGANDFNLVFKLIGVQFTKDRVPIGPVIPPPNGANDVEIELKPRAEEIVSKAKR